MQLAERCGRRDKFPEVMTLGFCFSPGCCESGNNAATPVYGLSVRFDPKAHLTPQRDFSLIVFGGRWVCLLTVNVS